MSDIMTEKKPKKKQADTPTKKMIAKRVGGKIIWVDPEEEKKEKKEKSA
jgi:hypothetical protein